jgi:hypothetical protein
MLSEREVTALFLDPLVPYTPILYNWLFTCPSIQITDTSQGSKIPTPHDQALVARENVQSLLTLTRVPCLKFFPKGRF